jgi:large subunit ribosomal protein L24
MAISKIQAGDKVKVLSGNFKNHVGVIVKVIKKTRNNGSVVQRVSVSGVKKLSKFKKKTNYQGQTYPGQITEVDRFLDISNVSLVDDKGQVSKVAIASDNGRKQRIYKTTKKTSI